MWTHCTNINRIQQTNWISQESQLAGDRPVGEAGNSNLTSGQSGTWTRTSRFQVRCREPLGHAAPFFGFPSRTWIVERFGIERWQPCVCSYRSLCRFQSLEVNPPIQTLINSLDTKFFTIRLWCSALNETVGQDTAPPLLPKEAINLVYKVRKE